jgi:hypothetical protein
MRRFKSQFLMMTAIAAVMYLMPGRTFAVEIGKIHGRVRDALSGEPLELVNVSLFENHEFTPYGTTTDSTGQYVIFDVPVGTYSIEFSFIGYKSLLMDSIEILPHKTAEQDAELNLSPIMLPTVQVRGPRIWIPPPPPPLPPYVPFNPSPTSMPVDNIEQIINNLVPGAVLIP